MDFKKILINMSLLSLLIFSIMVFIVTTQTDNSVTTKITDNEIINDTYSDLEDSIGSSASQTADDNFGSTTPTQQFGELEVTSIISPTKIGKTIIIGFWNTLVKLPISILGVSPAVATLIYSILIISLIIGIWAIWKGAISS